MFRVVVVANLIRVVVLCLFIVVHYCREGPKLLSYIIVARARYYCRTLLSRGPEIIVVHYCRQGPILLSSLLVVGPDIIVEPFGRRAKQFCRSDFRVSWRGQVEATTVPVWHLLETHLSDLQLRRPRGTTITCQPIHFDCIYIQIERVCTSWGVGGSTGWSIGMVTVLSRRPNIIVVIIVVKAKTYCRAFWSLAKYYCRHYCRQGQQLLSYIIVARARNYCRTLLSSGPNLREFL